MATITKSNRPASLAEAHQRVRSPLERLRKYIRGYVGLEGIAIFFLYLALWFWIGMLLDYGVFRLFHVDWVQEASWSVRFGILMLVLSGLLAAVTLKVFLRLFREFRDAALALVLERRFPKLLGDRLITAVELSDPRQAEALGYSGAMVRETIHEAAERVDQLPIKQVFDWRRLFRRGALIVLLTAGAYGLVGGAFCAIDYFQKHSASTDGFSDLNYVSTVWFERNILLRNTIWPRRAHLEILNYPDEMRIAEGTTPPQIKVRAYKYVVTGAPKPKVVAAYRAWLHQSGARREALQAAAPAFSCVAAMANAGTTTGASVQGLTSAAAQATVAVQAEEAAQAFAREPAEGWRPLTWFDLTPDIYGKEVPSVSLPEAWEPLNPGAGLTLDEIELKLDEEDAKGGEYPLSGDTFTTLREVLDQIHARASDPSQRRKLRELILPEKVTLVYKGRTQTIENTLQKGAGNTYSGSFQALRESVSFTVSAEDYSTARRRLVVVKAPTLESLQSEEWRPAYLYYRPDPQGKEPMVLRGMKQRFAPVPVSTQADVSLIKVPAGTDVVLTAVSSKPLQKVEMIAHIDEIKPGESRAAGKAGALSGTSPELQQDKKTFSIRFNNVRTEQSFELLFTDTDGIARKRIVDIVPEIDAPPQIREFKPDEVVRQIAGGVYMVTNNARVPFRGKVVDDHGLSGVRFLYSLRKNTSAPSTAAVQAASWGLGADAGNLFGTIAYLAGIKQQEESAEAKAGQEEEKSLLLLKFQKALDDHEIIPAQGNQPAEFDFIPHARVVELLKEPQQGTYRQRFNIFDVTPDTWIDVTEAAKSDFPVWMLGLKLKDDKQTYEMTLRLEAEDTDVESHPEIGRHNVTVTPEKITFLVVSAKRLKLEIDKEQEELLSKRDVGVKAITDRVGSAETKLINTYQDLTTPRISEDKLRNVITRADQVREMLDSAHHDVQAVAKAYDRIMQEEKLNQFDEKEIKKIQDFVASPLKRAEDLFVKADGAVGRFRTPLDDPNLQPGERVSRALDEGPAAKTAVRDVLEQLKKVRDAMEELTKLEEYINRLENVDEGEERINRVLKNLKTKFEGEFFPTEDPSKKPKK